MAALVPAQVPEATQEPEPTQAPEPEPTQVLAAPEPEAALVPKPEPAPKKRRLQQDDAELAEQGEVAVAQRSLRNYITYNKKSKDPVTKKTVQALEQQYQKLKKRPADGRKVWPSFHGNEEDKGFLLGQELQGNIPRR